jgi:hypothetical protein
MPGDNNPVRLPTFPSIERTSVLAFNATDTISVGTLAQPAVPRRGALFKHSVSPLWLDILDVTPYAWGATWRQESQGTLNEGSRNYDEKPEKLLSGNGVYDTLLLSLFSNPGVTPMGEYDGYPMLYVQGGSKLLLSVDSSGSNQAIASLHLEGRTIGGELITKDVQLGKTANTGTPLVGYTTMGQTCFLRPIRLEAPNANTGYTFAATLIATNMTADPVFTGSNECTPGVGTPPRSVLFPLVKAPASQVSPIPFTNTRTTAAAVLFTNVTKALNKEGTVLAGRFNPAVTNPFDVSASSYVELLPTEKYFYGMENGFYTYAAMSDTTDHFREDIFQVTVGAVNPTPVNVPVVHLADNSLINVFLFSDPDGQTNLAVNVDWHIEYRNTSVLWPSAISTVSLETVHQLQLVLLQTGFFFENDNHRPWLRKLTSALSMIRPYASAALKGAMATVPGGSALYGGAQEMYSAIKGGKRGPNKPKEDKKKKKHPGMQGTKAVKVSGPKPTSLHAKVSKNGK